MNHDGYAQLRPDLQAIADMVPAGVKALDLGCGDGGLLEFLVRASRSGAVASS